MNESLDSHWPQKKKMRGRPSTSPLPCIEGRSKLCRVHVLPLLLLPLSWYEALVAPHFSTWILWLLTLLSRFQARTLGSFFISADRFAATHA